MSGYVNSESWRGETNNGRRGLENKRNILVLLKIFFLSKIFLLFASILVWSYFIFFNSYFLVSNIKIDGITRTSQQELQAYINTLLKTKKLWVIPNTSYFAVNDKKMADSIKDKFLFENVSVKKEFPRTLNIIVEEKNSNIIYNTGKDYYLIDSIGNVLEVLGKAEDVGSYVEIPRNAHSKCRIRYIVRRNDCTEDELKDTVKVYYPNKEYAQEKFGVAPILINTFEKNIYIKGSKLNLDESLFSFIVTFNHSILLSKIFPLHHYELIQGPVANPGLSLYAFSDYDWYVVLPIQYNEAIVYWNKFMIFWRTVLSQNLNKLQYADTTLVDRWYYRLID